MVYSTTVFHCDKCKKPHRTFKEASECEIDHIVEDTCCGFKADLSKIVGKDDRHDT